MTITSSRTHWPRAFLLSTAVVFAACSGSSTGNSGGQGGSGSGGSSSAPASSGGSSSAGSGGANSGGTVASSGGTVAGSGGTSAGSGGTVASSGGTSASSGGKSSAGGASSSGGVTSTGGVSSSGGTSSAGGSSKAGGSTAAGGSSGGTTGTGGASGGGGVTTVTGLPAASAVLASMRSANDWFMTKHPDPGAAIDANHASNLWTRAAYFEGLMAFYNVETDATKKTSYYNYAETWGKSHNWALYTGSATNADEQACGQTYIDLYNIDKDPTEITAIKAGIDSLVKNPTTGSPDGWWWIDAIQMSMPSFAKLGVIYPTGGYFDGMWVMYNDARNKEGGGLFNATDGLWWRDKHFTPGGGTQQTMTAALNNAIPATSSDAYIVSPAGKSIYWSRGNGWVFTALVRVLDILPTTDAHRATYVSDFQAMAKALIAVQRTDGFWNESLADPTHCSAIGLTGQDGPETSGTAFFTYGLGWGIRKGLLDAATYSAPLQKAWNGLSTVALQSNGLLGYTQSTGDRPCTDTAALGPTKLPNYDDYGVGGFLLAGSEVFQLASH